MTELKPCPICGKRPEMQTGEEFESIMIKVRFACLKCRVVSKSAITTKEAVWEWNRMVEDGQTD